MFNKSFILALLAAFAFVFTSCEKDKDKDDPKPNLEAQLSKNEWSLTEQRVKIGSNAEQSILTTIYAQTGLENASIKLDGQGGFILYSDGEEAHEGEYQIEDGKITWDYPATLTWLTSEEYIHTYSVEVNGNTLKIVSNTTYEGDTMKETLTFTAK